MIVTSKKSLNPQTWKTKCLDETLLDLPLLSPQLWPVLERRGAVKTASQALTTI